MEVVSRLRSILAERVGQDRYDVWFGPGARLVPNGNTLQVLAPNRFVRDRLRSNFSDDLKASCEQAFGRPMALEFCVDNAIAAEPPRPKRDATSRSPSQAKRSSRAASLATAEHSSSIALAGQTTRSDQIAANDDSANEPSRSTSSVNGEPTTPARPRRQLHSLASFVVGDSNCLAAKTVEVALQKPGAYSPLVVFGPTGVGKTHLLEGLLGAFRQQRRGTAVYLSAEQFTSQFLEALHGSGLPSFRRKYRNVGLLAIDDIQFFAGKKVTLTELQHTVDTLLRSGAQLALAADRSPSAIKSLGPELIARLQGGAVCRIEPPEFATRLGIVRRLADELDIDAPPAAQEYIAHRLTSQSRELAGALKRLHAANLAHQTGRTVRLADIERAVCEVFGLDAASLQADGKTKAVSHPRMLAMWLARKHTRSALSEIGQYFGRRSHSTVISAQRKIDGWISKGQAVGLADRSWSLEEAVRRVEEQMRAG